VLKPALEECRGASEKGEGEREPLPKLLGSTRTQGAGVKKKAAAWGALELRGLCLWGSGKGTQMRGAFLAV